jgi:hypothetical protein
MSELIDTESQILSISRNVSFPVKDMKTPDHDGFNMDEIEKRNEDRLKRLMDQERAPSGDILVNFMRGNSFADRSIPTSPSTYQNIPFAEL